MINAPKNGEKFLRDSGSFNKRLDCGSLRDHNLTLLVAHGGK